jgi:hypothetical protein
MTQVLLDACVLQIAMSSSADGLSVLTEKLKKTINEIQERYESFIDSNQLYRQGKIKERDFFASIGDYLVASSTMNFITVQTIFEMKSLVEKKASKRSQGPQSESESDASIATPQWSSDASKFAAANQTPRGGQFSLPKPQQPQSWVADTSTQLKLANRQESGAPKKCTACNSAIAKQAKFCIRCGNPQ